MYNIKQIEQASKDKAWLQELGYPWLPLIASGILFIYSFNLLCILVMVVILLPWIWVSEALEHESKRKPKTRSSKVN